ncbi:MAG: hypothetical protein PUF04_09460 [bacterium]|nr:hypothetical protein [bacterium]
MLRDIVVNGHNAALATYKAAVDMKTGMAVVKGTDNTVSLAADAKDVFFVQKARIPTGANAAVLNHSDWLEEYNTVKAGDCVVLYKYQPGDLFATDAFESEDALASMDNGDGVTFADGILAAGDGTHYVFRGVIMDAGHPLALIEYVE